MPDGPPKEIGEKTGFPPNKGELMIRRLLYNTASENKWSLEQEELTWFDEVGNPGENWHY